MGGDIERFKVMEEKMRERRNWRMSLFTAYQGDYVEISLGDEDYKKYRITSLLLISAAAALHISAGFINNPGMLLFYIVIPYIAALGSIVYFYLFRFQLPRQKNKFRMGEVNLLFNRLRNACLLQFISLGIILTGEILLMRDTTEGAALTGDWLFLALIGAEMLAVLFLLVKQFRMAKIVKVI